VAIRVRARSSGELRLAHQDPLSLAIEMPADELRFLARGVEDVILRGTDGPYELELAVRPVGTRVALEGHLGAFLVGDQLDLVAEQGATATFSCAMPLRASV
ncbi:MAG: hypothetical protein ACKO4Q_12200, partial [Planctomycetota bacterium]